ncbi:hypothetical protein ACTXG6_02655 [Pseudonocardia sp. Cha107L01]|uniref:hypothetical protein n=1 Tax=Pseudonocardia sp. Cha107L01 TaxID=3457576 RepID=UPI00403EC660
MIEGQLNVTLVAVMIIQRGVRLTKDLRTDGDSEEGAALRCAHLATTPLGIGLRDTL